MNPVRNLILGIDSSSQNLSFSILKGNKLLFDFNRCREFGASSLIIEIHKAFKKLSLEPKDFDIFVIGCGPGSFTGLRVSFSIVKAFSIATGKPIISLSSFFSCAWPFKDNFKDIAVICDARKNLIYYGSFRSQNGNLIERAKIKLISLEGLTKVKADIFITYDPYLRRKLSDCGFRMNIYPKDVYPRSACLVAAVKNLYTKDKFTAVEKLEPLYLHPKTCQIRRKK